MPNSFRRITCSGNYTPEIDGIRFVAISAVFLFHLAGDVLRHSAASGEGFLRASPLFWFSQVLNIGVQLFFVLSGYVLTVPFVREYRDAGPSVSIRRYLTRRITRLEPPYVLSLLVFFSLKIAAHRGSATALLPHLGASLCYVHNLVYGGPSDINFVAWSLEIEVQFYLLAPVLCFVFFRVRSAQLRKWMLVVSCVGWGAVSSWLPAFMHPGLSLLGQMPYFLAGLLLAEIATSISDLRKSSLVCDLLALGLFALLFCWIRMGWVLPYVGALTIAGSYWAAFQSRWVRNFLRWHFVSIVGGMCYSIYLLHNFVIGFAGQYSEKFAAGQPFPLRLLVEGCLLGPVVLLVSGVFYVIVERPCMRPDWPARFAAFIRMKKAAFNWTEGAAGPIRCSRTADP